MEDPSLTRRVEILEQQVGSLKELPTRMTAVEAQILKHRDETHREFSAMRQEISAQFDRQDERFEDLKRYMLMLHEDAIDRIARLGER